MSEVPDDLMKVARGCFCAKEVGTPSSMPLTLARIERALAAERERATLAERERWQIPQLQSTIFRAVRP